MKTNHYLFLSALLLFSLSCSQPGPANDQAAQAQPANPAEKSSGAEKPILVASGAAAKPSNESIQTAASPPTSERQVTEAIENQESPQTESSKPTAQAAPKGKENDSAGNESKQLIASEKPPANKSAVPSKASIPTAYEQAVDLPKPKVVEKKLGHELWDQLLRQHVSASGRVDYRGFKADQAKLQQYLDFLSANPPKSSAPRAERLAFWINVYNAFTVQLITDHYPVSSITKLHGGKPWDVKWIKIGGSTYSLDQVENEIIRPRFKEARIHFAVNCAAKSCPPLLNRAWTASKLERMLDKQSRAFINNSSFNTLGAKSVKLSKIFEWYREDFGDLIAFLNRYAEVEIQSRAKISFVEYNWALNE